MAGFITEPFDFEQARKYLAGRGDKVTALKSRQIAQTWDVETRRRAFFSARVASATVLGELHKRCQDVVTGRMTDTQARELLRRFLSGNRELMASLGFALPENAGDALGQLGSVRRLQLIIDTQARMAQEVGNYQAWMDNADAAPYGVWHLGTSEEHRRQHVAHDGKAFRYDHPIWTTDPPGGLWNCHCWREELSWEQCKSRGLSPQPADTPLVASELNFDPSQGLNAPIPVSVTIPDAIKNVLMQQLGKAPAVELAASSLDQGIEQARAQCVTKKVEYFHVLSDDGTHVFPVHRSGPSGGKVPYEWVGKMNGKTFLHNHPQQLPGQNGFGQSFSVADIKTASSQGLRQIIAASPRRDYIMTAGPTGWPEKRAIALAYNKAELEAKKLLLPRFGSGKITWTQYCVAIDDMAWKKVAKDTGMVYRVVRKKAP